MLSSWKKTLTVLSSALALSSIMISPSAQAVESFSKAKKILPSIYYELQQKYGYTSTIYCGCELSYKGSGKNVRWSVDLDSCGYEARKNLKRAQRIEVEHVMSAWEFGHQLKCWREGGRKNCGDNSVFDEMEGDLHNLYPAVGEVNGDRGNFQFTDMGAKPTQYGQCQMVVDFKGKKAQPPKDAMGPIARAHLYMAEQYNIRLAPAQRKLYEAWNKQHPATPFECDRNELIKKAQGNYNRFISESCKLTGNGDSSNLIPTPYKVNHSDDYAQELYKKVLNKQLTKEQPCVSLEFMMPICLIVKALS